MVEIESNQWIPLDAWRHLRHSMKIKWHTLRDASSHVTWRNMSAPSSIERIGLNDDDLHHSVSSKPLIEDQSPNPTKKPNFASLCGPLTM